MSRIVLNTQPGPAGPATGTGTGAALVETLLGGLLALAFHQIWSAASEPGWDPRRPLPRERSSSAIAAARAALAEDLPLQEAGLRLIPGARGSIELHGWVTSRLERVRAAQLVANAISPANLVNALLVRGEDDITTLEDPDRATA